MKVVTTIMLLFLFAIGVPAQTDSVTFASPEQEQRYKTLISELRCLVCQNQNIADSNAALAGDLRRQVHEMIEQGDTDQAIIDFMVARYGDFVLYRPPFKGITVLLWVGPFLFLVGGLVVIIIITRRRSRRLSDTLSESEQAHIRQLLEERKQMDQ